MVEVTEDAEVSLDPFRVFDTDEARIRYGAGFLTLLTSTPPGSAAGAHLHRAAKQALGAAHDENRLARLVDVIERFDPDGPAGEVAEKLEALASVSY